MAGEAAEIRVKLILDPQALAAGAHIAQGEVEKLGGGAHDLKEKMGEAGGHGSFAMGALGGAVALMGEKLMETFHEAEESVKEFIGETVSAAEEAVQQEKAITGVLSMVDAGSHSIAELHGYAEGLHEELDQIGIASGVSADAIQEAFTGLALRSNKSIDDVMRLTDAMATAGKAVPGGVGALSSGFEAMEMGVIRARNPVVALIAATGTLHGTAKSVAAQLMKMSPEAAMKLGEKAIDAMASKMEKAPQSYTGLIQSLKDVQHHLMEATGKPILERLNPQLEALKGWLMNHSEQIEHYANLVGQEIGKVITFVGDAVQGIYAGIVENWNGVKDAFNDIWGEWNEAWNYASGQSTAIQISFKEMGKALVESFVEISRYVKAAAEVAMDANDLIHGRAAGSTQAAIQGNAVAGLAEGVGKKTSTREFDDAAYKYAKLAEDAGMSATQVDAYVNNLRQIHDANMQDAEKAKGALASENFEDFSKYLNTAINIHSDAATKYALSLVAGSEEAQKALVQGAIHIDGGLEALRQVIEDQSPELASKMATLLHPKMDVKPSNPTVNFNGNTFNIKQDFREQDPDRIAIVFRKDVAASATSRVQSKVATPFGF